MHAYNIYANYYDDVDFFFFLLSCVYQNIYIYRNPRGLISMRVVSVCFCCLILPYSILFYMYKYIWMMMYSFIYQQNTLYVYEILLSAKVTCFNTYNSLKYVLFTKYFFFFIIVIIIYLCAFDFWSVVYKHCTFTTHTHTLLLHITFNFGVEMMMRCVNVWIKCLSTHYIILHNNHLWHTYVCEWYVCEEWRYCLLHLMLMKIIMNEFVNFKRKRM